MKNITINPTDQASLAAAIQAGITTPKMLADWIDDAELIDDCLVINPGEWHADDGNAEIVEDHDDGEEAAQSYVDDGDWGDGTTWIDVSVWQSGINAGGEIVRVNEGSHTIEVNQEEPECTCEDGHDWQSPIEIVGGIKENPGVWGHGGGVIINEVCIHCGCGKTTDTWAQNPNNGVQGLTSVSYEAKKYSFDAE